MNQPRMWRSGGASQRAETMLGKAAINFTGRLRGVLICLTIVYTMELRICHGHEAPIPFQSIVLCENASELLVKFE